MESLPRRTLQERVDYWAARHRIEAPPEPSRVRPYVMNATERRVVFRWFG